MNTKKAKSPLNGSVDLLSKALRDVIVEAVAHDRLETREVLRAGIREDVRIAVKESESVLLESHESDMKEFSKKVDSSGQVTIENTQAQIAELRKEIMQSRPG